MQNRPVQAALAVAAVVAFTSTAPAQAPGVTGTLIVTNKTPATATIVDVASGRSLATLSTGMGPHEVVVSSDGRLAVVTDYGTQQPGRTLTVIDVPALRVARTIDLGEYTRPHGVAFLPGDSLVVVTSETTRNVVIVNVVAGAVRSAIGTNNMGSHMVGVTANGAMAYTGNIGSHSVSELDLRTGKFTKQWTVPNQPEAINVTPDGREAWVGSNATGKVSVVDTRSGSVTTAAEGFGWPYRVLFTPDARMVLLPDYRNEELRFLDRASKREVGRMSFAGAGPQGIAITPDGLRVFQSLSKQGRVAIVDANAFVVVGQISVGETPDGVAYTTRVVTAPPPQARPEDVSSVDGIIAALYEVISGPAGQKRDWNRFTSLFAPGARLIPTGRRPDGTQGMRVITPQEYAASSGPRLEEMGFFEREIGRSTQQFGAVTHVFSAYDSKRAASDTAPFARGINSIQLVNDGRRWWVVTVLWDSERADNPIPPQYLGKP